MQLIEWQGVRDKRDNKHEQNWLAAARITEDTTLSADASGIHIRVGKKQANLPWRSVSRIAKKPTMIILYTDAAHGYVLSNRVLGGEREAFYNYAVSRAEKGRTEGKS